MTVRMYLAACLVAFLAGVIITCLVAIEIWPKVNSINVPPSLHCTEEEAVWWTGTETLGCVHHEDVFAGPT